MGVLNFFFGAFLVGIVILVPAIIVVCIIEENDKGEK